MPFFKYKKKKKLVIRKHKPYFQNHFNSFRSGRRKSVSNFFSGRYKIKSRFTFYNFKNFGKSIQKKIAKKRYVRLLNRFSLFNRFRLLGRKKRLIRFVFYKKTHFCNFKFFLPSIKNVFFKRLRRRKRFFIFKRKNRRSRFRINRTKGFRKPRKLRFSKKKYTYRFSTQVRKTYQKRKYFRKTFIRRIFRRFKIRRIRRNRNKRFVSLFSTWRPISRYYYFKKRFQKRKLRRISPTKFVHFGLISKKIWSGRKAKRRILRSFRSTYFVKLIQSYNNFFLQLCNSVSQRVYLTFTAGRVPVLRRNRRKTMQTLLEAVNIFSKRIKRFHLKFIQLWIIGPINYFIRKFVKALKINKFRISSVTHLLKNSHNGLRQRSLRRV